MISKKTTRRQRYALALISAAEFVAKQTPFVICSGITILTIIGIQKLCNRQVIANCNSDLYELVTYPTALGESYVCRSRMFHYGPPAPLRD